MFLEMLNENELVLAVAYDEASDKYVFEITGPCCSNL